MTGNRAKHPQWICKAVHIRRNRSIAQHSTNKTRIFRLNECDKNWQKCWSAMGDKCTTKNWNCKLFVKRLRWSRGSVLAFGTQVCGFAPGRSRRIFRAKNILSMPSLGGEVKPSVPFRSFTACKRSLNVTWKSAFRQNYRTHLAHSSTFRRWVL